MKNLFSNKNILAILILFILCLLSYGNSFQNEFLMDDYTFILDKDNVSSVSTLSFFTEGFKGIFRPVVLTVFKFEIMFFGNSVSGYHILNLILFFVVCLLFFYLLNILTNDYTLSLLVSIFYAIHPINNFLINYKTSICFLLFYIFMQTTTILFLKFIDQKNLKVYCLSLIFYLLALFCHEICFMLPVYLFLIAHFLKDISIKKNIFICFPFIIPFIIYMLMRSQISKSIEIGGIFNLGISLIQYINTIISLLGWYISKLIVPVNIIFTWDERLAEDVFMFWNIIILAVVVFGSVIALIKGRKNLKVFSLIFFIAGLIPAFLASFTYTASMKTVAIEPHWFGFTSIGFFILAACLFQSMKKFMNPKVWFAVMMILVITLSLWTRNGNAVWHKAESFCDYWLETNSINGSAWHCKANAYLIKNDKGLDKSKYQKCEQISALGISYLVIGDAQSAMDYFNESLKMDRNCVISHYGLGILYARLEHREEAEQSISKAKKINAQFFPAYELFLDVFNKRQEKDSARRIKDIIF